MAYDGTGREIVARLKYANARSSLPWLAAAMADVAARTAGPVDVVTWVPTTAERRRRRGYDQARLLATAMARRLGCPCRSLLRRLPGPPQTGRPRAERLVGPRLVVRARARAPAAVLVVDDVATTGSTLAAAGRVLRAAGAVEIHAVVAARRGRAGLP